MEEKFAGIIFFNDTPELLEKCMIALKANGFKIVAIDGAFQEFPLAKGEKYYSTDGCLDVAWKYADINIESPIGGWFNQATKRTQYFKAVPLYSYVFSIDADEIMQPFSWDFELTEDVYRIKQKRFHEDGTTLMLGTVRGYKVYPDLEYLYRHCTIYRTSQHKEGDLESGLVTRAKGSINPTRPMVKDKAGNFLIIHNRQDLRSERRRAQKKEYKEKRKEWDYRKKLNDF
jgi:hypothetical protein